MVAYNEENIKKNQKIHEENMKLIARILKPTLENAAKALKNMMEYLGEKKEDKSCQNVKYVVLKQN